MVGPRDAVIAQRDAFLELAASFRTAQPDAAPADGPVHSGGLVFEAPDGWQRGGERQMRLATWTGDGWECSVTMLNGDGGGLAANVGRWYEQVGQPRPSAAEIDALERIPLLGGDAVLVVADGAYRGMFGDSIDDARLVGAIRLVGPRSLFVKVTGQRDAVAAMQDEFVAFCGRIQEDRR